jgi:quinone-modifying oxidoreductase subunit QmoB
MDEGKAYGKGRRPSASPGVMVFGGGACARRVAANMAACGIDTWLAATDEAPPADDSRDAVNWLVGSELTRCHGFAGNFELRLKNGNGLFDKTVSAVVVAEDSRHSPNHACYGLTHGPRVVDISTLESMLSRMDNGHPFTGDETVVFLCGWSNDSQPEVAKRMLDGCYYLQHRIGVAAYFITGNLKVAERGAEARVQEAKQSGAVFLKFTDDYPTIEPKGENRFGVVYTDELTRTPFRLEADWVVVDETVESADTLPILAERLRIHCDDAGFAQRDNIHRLSNTTNRRGIFVAGGGRGVMSAEQQMADADRVCLKVMAFIQDLDKDPRPPATIRQERCARCLTCYRLCPHAAIDIGDHISIVEEACQRCGICTGSCPGHAIEMEGVPESPATAESRKSAPRIMVFGCARSVGPALEGRSLPEGVQFVEVPCGGAIAERHLLAAFESGADGVMLCTCHTENCLSESGNQVARKRAATVSRLLNTAGLENQRLRVNSAAANMGAELAGMIRAFSVEISALAGS